MFSSYVFLPYCYFWVKYILTIKSQEVKIRKKTAGSYWITFLTRILLLLCLFCQSLHSYLWKFCKEVILRNSKVWQREGPCTYQKRQGLYLSEVIVNICIAFSNNWHSPSSIHIFSSWFVFCDSISFFFCLFFNLLNYFTCYMAYLSSIFRTPLAAVTRFPSK